MELVGETRLLSIGLPMGLGLQLGVGGRFFLKRPRLTLGADNVFQAFAQAHKDNGLIMDFAIGPNQGTGVPAPEGSDGLSWDLVAFNVSVPTGGSFDGVLPGWGTGTL